MLPGKHQQSRILHNMGARRRHHMSRQTDGGGGCFWGGGASALQIFSPQLAPENVSEQLSHYVPRRATQTAVDVMQLLLSLKPRVCSANVVSSHVTWRSLIYYAMFKGGQDILVCLTWANLSFYRTVEILYEPPLPLLASLVYNWNGHETDIIC